MINRVRRAVPKPLALAIASILSSTTATHVCAVEINWGEVSGSFDSTFTYGASFRVEDRDWDLVGKSNQPEFNNNANNWHGYDPVLNPGTSGGNVKDDVWLNRGAYSTNGDNANLHWDPGKAFSNQVKGVHELQLDYGNYGLFVRGMWFYDFALMNNTGAWNDPITGAKYDPCRDSDAKERACRDIRLLDAYVSANWDLDDMGEKTLSMRVGRQVLNWGESTFISHGISEIVPVDIARLRAPGSELREAFEPIGMVWASLGLNENVNIEAFYQFEWRQSQLPPPGTYFSTNDFAGHGGDLNNVQLGFAKNPDTSLDALIDRMNAMGQGDGAFGALTDEQMLAAIAASGREVALKNPNQEPKDTGQYGLRLGWFVPELNDTEFGFYYVNYHSRRPLINAKASNFTAQSLAGDLAFMRSNTITSDNISQIDAFAQGYLVYPEDIQMLGLSFNTAIGETSLAGEYSFRKDEPLQIDDVEMLTAAMLEQVSPVFEGVSQVNAYRQSLGMSRVGQGESFQGYIESDTSQLQATATHLFGPTLGADSMAFLAEVGGVWIHDMPDQSLLRLNGPGTDRSGGFAASQGLEAAVQDGVESNPFPSSFSWGYRALAKLTYNDAFMGINVSPRLFFSHDVKGITPDPMFLFIEGRKSTGLAVSFDYLLRWQAEFSYNAFFDGVGTTNRMADRDYVSFNIKYSI